MITEWLNARYKKQPDGTYYAHSPVYGARGQSERGIIARFIRADNVIRALERSGINAQSKLVDIGASDGHLAATVAKKFGCYVMATDISAEACERTREIWGIDAEQADACKLQFTDNQFDFVVCMETLEHIPEFHKALSEILRVGKTVIITVPNESVRKTARSHLSVHPHAHLWNFKKNSFDFLSHMGFNVASFRHTSTTGLILYMLIEKFGLLSEKMVNLCVKLDRLICGVPPSWGWLFVITRPTKSV